MTRKRRLGALAAGVLLLALLAVGGGSSTPVLSPTLRLGVGSTEEQRMLAALTITALRRAGIAVEAHTDLGGTQQLRQEARRGGIDLYWDYTGAAWSLGMGQQNLAADPEESYERVQEEDAAQRLVWLEPSKVNATLALFVRQADRPQNGTLTDLARELSAGGGPLCADDDFIRRPAGYADLAEQYSIASLIPVRTATEPEALAAVASGACFAGLATATSGEARRAGLVPVVDDQRVFPAFIAAPVARRDALERRPAIAAALAPLSQALTTEVLADLNGQLAAGADPQAIAERFLGAP